MDVSQLIVCRMQSLFQLKELLSKTKVKHFDPNSLKVDDYGAILQAIKALDEEMKEFQRGMCKTCKTLIQEVSIFEEVQKQIKLDYITISVSGRFNTGKSSLINCLLQQMFLPEGIQAETAVRVYIQHDPRIHVACPNPAPCSECPQMKPFVTTPTSSEEIIYGVKEIHCKMKTINAQVRANNQNCVDQTLLTNIPVLGTLECMTSGRKLFLVDNPGVGDSNEDANLLADMSLKTSQAFVYIMDYHAIDEKEVVEFLTKKKGQICQGQFIAVVNKFDLFYTTTTSVTTADEIKRVKSLLSKNLALPEECVVPVSSKWKNWSMGYLPEQKDEIDFHTKQYSKKIWSKKSIHVPPSTTSQGTISNQDLYTLQILLQGSNFDELQTKLEEVVRTCVHQRNCHIKHKVMDLLKYARDAYNNFVENETTVLSQMKNYVASLKSQHESLISAFEHLSETTKLTKDLEMKYEDDIKEPAQNMKEILDGLLHQFDRKCHTFLNFKQVKQEIETLMIDVATKIDAKLNETSFDVMNQVLTSYCTELGAKSSKLNHDTGALCSQINEIFSSASPEASVKGFNSSIDAFERPIRRKDLFPSPTLLDMKAEIQIIPLRLSIINQVRLLLRRIRQYVSGIPLDDFYLSEEQLEDLLQKVQATLHKQCEDYFATNKDKIVKWMILRYGQIYAKETAKYYHKWDDFMKSAAHSILQLHRMTVDCEQYLGHILANTSHMDTLCRDTCG